MCQGRLEEGADRNISGIHVDGGVSIKNSHKSLLDGECSIARAYGEEVVCAGQEGLSLLWWAITDGYHDKVDADEHDCAQ